MLHSPEVGTRNYLLLRTQTDNGTAAIRLDPSGIMPLVDRILAAYLA